MENDIGLIKVMKFLSFFNLTIWLLANAIKFGSAFDETNEGCYLDTNGKLYPKSLYNIHSSGRTVSIFYGKEIEIWAGFGPLAVLKKKNWNRL